MGTLSGVRVLDLSRYIAGPTASMMLADQGAEVIKVESVPVGDPSRQSGPFDGGHSVYFMSANRNKRSLAINMHTEEGRAAVAKIASRSDVLIENFKPGTTARMGVGPEQLAETNPSLVYCSITGFGTGPTGSDMAGFDQNVQAMSGLMSVTGTQETGPLRVGIPIADSTTGLVAAFAIAAKLAERAHTGIGGVVSTSLMQSMNFLMTYQAQKYLSLGLVPQPEGNDHPLLFPGGTFRAQDGFITIASGNEKMWRLLCASLDLDHLVDDPRFASNEVRLVHKVKLRRLIEERLASNSANHWIEVIGAGGVPCGPVLDMEGAFTHPVAAELELSRKVRHSALGEMEVLGRPAVTGSEDWLRLPPPMLGEHSTEILREFGYDQGFIDDLVTAGSVIQP